MLLAYIDEIGSSGAFVHPSHQRFSDSPAFGYGGFIIPEENAREFGAFSLTVRKNSSATKSLWTPILGAGRRKALISSSLW